MEKENRGTKTSTVLVTKVQIDQTSATLADQIRAYVRQQVDIWRRLPRLALDADGRHGFSQTLRLAYQHGYWDVSSLSLFVDLLTGELVVFRQTGGRTHPCPASDEAVITFVDQLHLFEAAVIERSIRDELAQPPSGLKTPDELAEWREKISANLGGLGEVYEAKNRRGYPYFGAIF